MAAPMELLISQTSPNACTVDVKSRIQPDTVVHAFIPSTQEQRKAGLCEFGASLVYRGCFRVAKAT